MAGNEMTGTILEIVYLRLISFIQEEEKETRREVFDSFAVCGRKDDCTSLLHHCDDDR